MTSIGDIIDRMILNTELKMEYDASFIDCFESEQRWYIFCKEAHIEEYPRTYFVVEG